MKVWEGVKSEYGHFLFEENLGSEAHLVSIVLKYVDVPKGSLPVCNMLLLSF